MGVPERIWLKPEGEEYVRSDLYDALRAQVEAMRKERRDDMRAAYKAGYETRKIGAGLSEGWATFFAGVIAKPTGSPDGQQ